MRRLSLVLGLGAGLCVPGAPARGQEVTVFAVDGALAEGCPGPARFLEEVAGRTRRARPAGPGEPAARFQLVVRPTAAGFAGTLAPAERPEAARTVEAETCAEVLGALGLTLALTLDPEALVTPPSAAPPPPAEAAAPPPVEPTTTPPPAPPAPGRWALVAGGEALGLLLPVALVGPALGVAREPAERGPGGVIWTATAQILVGAPEDELPRARVRLARAGLGACPAGLGGPRWSVRPCVGLAAGVMRARGAGISQPRTALYPWLDVGAGVRVGWRSAGGLGLDLDLGAALPVNRPAGRTDIPAEVVFRTRSLGARAGLLASYRFR